MSQGVVFEYLRNLIAKQVDDRGLVVWYDPEQAYGAAVADLYLPSTTVARYDGSFFKLRKEIDHLLDDGQPPRLLVYVSVGAAPKKPSAASIELDFAGVIMQPRQQPHACNTRLSVVARNALKPSLGEDQVAEIERQVEAGFLTLADLNSLAGKDLSTAVLTLIFGSGNPQEVALAFLHGDQHDEEIGKKSAEKELRHLLQVGFDVELPASANLANLRERLARHVLLTDLVTALGEHVPSALAGRGIRGEASSRTASDSCVRLARSWRNNRDCRDSYVDAANKIEHAVGPLSLGPWSVVSIRIPETSPQQRCHPRPKGSRTKDKGQGTKDKGVSRDLSRGGTSTLMRYVENKLVDAPSADLLQIAVARQSRFWAEVEPAVQARWAVGRRRR